MKSCESTKFAHYHAFSVVEQPCFMKTAVGLTQRRRNIHERPLGMLYRGCVRKDGLRRGDFERVQNSV